MNFLQVFVKLSGMFRVKDGGFGSPKNIDSQKQHYIFVNR